MNGICYFDCDVAIVMSNLYVSPCRVERQGVRAVKETALLVTAMGPDVERVSLL